MSSTNAAGPTKQEIEAVFTRLRAQPANKVSSRSVPVLLFVLCVLILFTFIRSPVSIVPQRRLLGRPWRTASLYASTARLCTEIWACTWPLCGAPTWIRTGPGCSCARCSWAVMPMPRNSSAPIIAPAPTLRSNTIHGLLNCIGTSWRRRLSKQCRSTVPRWVGYQTCSYCCCWVVLSYDFQLTHNICCSRLRFTRIPFRNTHYAHLHPHAHSCTWKRRPTRARATIPTSPTRRRTSSPNATTSTPTLSSRTTT